MHTEPLLEVRMNITSDGHSNYAIVNGPQPGVHERAAAKDLQRYLQRISGVELPVKSLRTDRQPAIILGTMETVATIAALAKQGQLDLSDLGNEGYLIKTVETDVLIAANTGPGAMHGVYGFLEDVLGCRFFMPDEQIGEHVPRRATIELPALDIRDKPSLDLRAMNFGHVGCSRELPWAHKNRLNHVTFTDKPEQGGSQESSRNSFHIYPNGDFHSFQAILPPEKHFNDHPDWYPLIGGRRTCSTYTQLCTSNPEVAEAVADRLKREAEANPDVRWFMLGAEDAHGDQYWCQCQSCRALDEPGAPLERSNSLRYWTLVIAVAEKLKETHPDHKIVMGAYKDYMVPPATRDLKLPKNVVVMLCHQRPFCLLHPIAYKKQVENPDRTDARAENVVGSGACFNHSYRELVNTYSAMTSLCILEYYGKVGWFGLPWPLQQNLAQDFTFYRKLDLAGLRTNAGCNFGTNGQLLYLMAKFAWNTDREVDQMLDDYYEHFYGPSRKPMEKYFQRLCDLFEDAPLCSDGYFYQYLDRRTWLIKAFNETLLEELEGLLEQAENRAQDEIIRKRIELSRFSLEYTRRMLKLFAAMND